MMVLSLTCNQLSNIPDSFQECVNLTALHISSNRFRQLPRCVDNLTQVCRGVQFIYRCRFICVYIGIYMYMYIHIYLWILTEIVALMWMLHRCSGVMMISYITSRCDSDILYHSAYSPASRCESDILHHSVCSSCITATDALVWFWHPISRCHSDIPYQIVIVISYTTVYAHLTVQPQML